MYICIYTYMYTYVYIYIYICMYTSREEYKRHHSTCVASTFLIRSNMRGISWIFFNSLETSPIKINKLLNFTENEGTKENMKNAMRTEK
jgi:coproporphyrinogen III oxidase